MCELAKMRQKREELRKDIRLKIMQSKVLFCAFFLIGLVLVGMGNWVKDTDMIKWGAIILTLSSVPCAAIFCFRSALTRTYEFE